MIAEAGHLFLIIAFALSILQIFVPAYGIVSQNLKMISATSTITLFATGFVIAAFLALMHGFVTSDFSIALVAEHSHSSKPMIYKISGLWGNHEGSLLLWILILCLFGAVLAARFRTIPAGFKARILGVQGVIATAFMAFSLFTSNPFARLANAPLDGRGLNPVLQDPGLAMHPPMLYIGYVGLSLAFAFAVAGLIEGHIDNLWARWVRPFILAAWCALTLGIGLGSWWAYYELGWGGWWFWDPVENASLMPWLVATALLHSALVLERRGALKSWTVLLAILAFSLSLLGTFIVRSGILVSVHSFASDPSRGVFILAILMVAIGIPLALFAWRGPRLTSTGDFAFNSREGMLILNNLLLVSSTVVVLTGTLYPLAYELANGGKISVGPPYFNATFNPLLALMAIGMATGPLFAWRKQSLGRLWRVFGIMALAALIAMITYVFGQNQAGAAAIAATGIIIWLVAGIIAEIAIRIQLFKVPIAHSWRRFTGLPLATHAVTVAHFGFALFLFGAVADSYHRSETIIRAKANSEIALPDTVMGQGRYFEFAGVETREGPNYIAQTAILHLYDTDSLKLGTLTPEIRRFPVEQQTTSEAAILSRLSGDLYAVLGDGNEASGWTLRIYQNPFIGFIWIGAVIMTLGGGLAMTGGRRPETLDTKP